MAGGGLEASKLEQRGWVAVPARRRLSPNRTRHKQIRFLPHPTDPFVGSLSKLQPLQIQESNRQPVAMPLFDWLLHQYHYMGYTSAVGQNVQYLVRHGHRWALAWIETCYEDIVAGLAQRGAPGDGVPLACNGIRTRSVSTKKSVSKELYSPTYQDVTLPVINIRWRGGALMKGTWRPFCLCWNLSAKHWGVHELGWRLNRAVDSDWAEPRASSSSNSKV